MPESITSSIVRLTRYLDPEKFLYFAHCQIQKEEYQRLLNEIKKEEPKSFKFGEKTELLFERLLRDYFGSLNVEVTITLRHKEIEKFCKDNNIELTDKTYDNFYDRTAGDITITFINGATFNIDVKYTVNNSMGSITSPSQNYFGNSNIDELKPGLSKDLYDKYNYVHKPENNVYILVDTLFYNICFASAQSVFKKFDSMSRNYQDDKPYITVNDAVGFTKEEYDAFTKEAMRLGIKPSEYRKKKFLEFRTDDDNSDVKEHTFKGMLSSMDEGIDYVYSSFRTMY